jgi:hypothetical protein
MTIPFVECLDITNNVFTEKRPLFTKREGAGACIFEAALMIFVFGGSNMESERLDTIEQYDIQRDIWYLVEIKMHQAIGFPVCHALGRDKVLILGSVPTETFDGKSGKLLLGKEPAMQVIDLSAAINYITCTTQDFDKIYMPSFLDQNGLLHMFKGTLDNEPALEKYDISRIINLKV